MTQSALTPSSNLFDLIGPAADGTDFQIKFQKAKMISKGDPNQRWVKAVLFNNEDCFLFPDDDNTVNPKNYNIGTVFNVESHRPCRNPGATKWTTNVLHVDLQPEQLKQLEKHQTEIVNFEVTHSTSKAESTANNLLVNRALADQTKKTRVTITGDAIDYVDRMGKSLDIDHGCQTRSKVVQTILEQLKKTKWENYKTFELDLHWEALSKLIRENGFEANCVSRAGGSCGLYYCVEIMAGYVITEEGTIYPPEDVHRYD